MKNSVFNEDLKALHTRYFSEDFKKKRVRELENISSRYFPLPTAHHHHNYKNLERKVMSN